MAQSRHTRRKAAQARLAAKSARIASASLAHGLQERRAVTDANLATLGRKPRLQASPIDAQALMGRTHKGFSLGTFKSR